MISVEYFIMIGYHFRFKTFTYFSVMHLVKISIRFRCKMFYAFFGYATEGLNLAM